MKDKEIMVNVMIHKQCGEPLRIPGYGLLRENTGLKNPEVYCHNCDRYIDIDDHNEILYRPMSVRKVSQIRANEKNKRNSNLKTLEDKLNL